MTMAPDAHWPYPRWIAHRGAGKLAPENTLAAFRLGAAQGYRMFECDVKLSADGVPFLLHDAGLERTTNGLGVAGEHTWAALSRLDAGSWHSRQYAGEPLPTFDGVARWCRANGHDLNVEIKPTPGTGRETGAKVAEAAARLWAGSARAPLLTSFDLDALAAARHQAASLPRGLLLDQARVDWLDLARELGCAAVVLNHRLWDTDSRGAARAAGLRALAYTVNDDEDVDRLLALGLDGLITDRVDRFAPGP